MNGNETAISQTFASGSVTSEAGVAEGEVTEEGDSIVGTVHHEATLGLHRQDAEAPFEMSIEDHLLVSTRTSRLGPADVPGSAGVSRQDLAGPILEDHGHEVRLGDGCRTEEEMILLGLEDETRPHLDPDQDPGRHPVLDRQTLQGIADVVTAFEEAGVTVIEDVP